MPGVDPRFGQPNYEAVGADGKPMTYADAKDLRLHNTLMATRAGAPRVLFTVNTKTGELKDILREHEWLGHLQFSPTDPNLIMFCHEGTWHEVDRVWTIRADGIGPDEDSHPHHEHGNRRPRILLGRTAARSGTTCRRRAARISGWPAIKIATGKRTWYHLQRNEWSVHFNVSPDGTLFAGDGGDSEMVARAPDGKWIYLFRPERVPDVAGIKAAEFRRA